MTEQRDAANEVTNQGLHRKLCRLSDQVERIQARLDEVPWSLDLADERAVTIELPHLPGVCIHLASGDLGLAQRIGEALAGVELADEPQLAVA